MTNRMRHAVFVASFGVLGLAVMAAAPAETKHLHLERSEPMADSTVTVPPTVIRLWFSQPVQIGVTRVRLVGAANRAVEVAPPRVGDGTNPPVIAEVRGAVPAGRYTVSWRTMARDGHVVSGTFAFSVAAPATPAR